jgi:hypothetical protein
MSGLVRLTRGVWCPADAAEDLQARLGATLGVFPPDTVVAGATAGRLHGFWLPDALDGPIELIVHGTAPTPRNHAGTRRREVRARRRVLHPDEVEFVNGILTTTAARTWVDLAERFRMPDLVALGDSALRGGTTVDELGRVVARAVHRRGVVRARAALPLLNSRSRSRAESHLRYAVMSCGLPSPDVNKPIFTEYGEWLAEPDLSYEDVKLALEYNGSVHAEVKQMRKDITREIDIVHRGRWQSVTFGPAEVFGRPEYVGAVVRQLRRERGAEDGRSIRPYLPR